MKILAIVRPQQRTRIISKPSPSDIQHLTKPNDKTKYQIQPVVNENKEISNGESETSLEQVKDPNIENKLNVPEKEFKALSSMKPEEIVLNGFDESALKFDANRGSFMAEIKMECEENAQADSKPACKGAVVVENNNDTPLEKNSKNITNACNNKN